MTTYPKQKDGSVETGRLALLQVAVSYHQDRYGIEIRINSLLGDGSQSWVMMCTGLNKHVTEMSQEKQENRDDESGARAGKPAAKARPKQTSLPMSFSPRAKRPFNRREWIDVEPAFDVAKKMNRSLRHDRSVFREEDGAVEFKILAPMFVSQFESSPHWSIRTWLRYFAKRRRSQEEIPVLPGSQLSRYIPLPSSNSGPFWRKTNWSRITRQRDVTKRLRRVHLPRWKFPRHASHHPVRIDAWWTRCQKRRQTVFFTAVDPMSAHLHRQRDYDVTKPRFAVYKQVYRINFRVAEKKGLTFYQTKVWRDHPSQRSPSSLYWKSGVNEFARSAV